jgi:predicted metal-dependent hydrolase
MHTQLKERTFVWQAEPRPHGGWLAGDPVRSAMFNVMSLGIGAHEVRVMRTFRKIESQVRDPAVKDSVKALIGQEAQHFQAHDPLNAGLTRADPELRRFYERIRSRHLQLSEASTYEAALGYLLATEFSFGCMGRAFLTTEKFFDGADPDIAALWIYHSIEELEHTRVSFDVVIDHFTDRAVPRLLKGSLQRVLGYDDGDLTTDTDLQIKFTDKLRFAWVTDFVDALNADSMRAIGIRDVYSYFMSEDCVFFRRSAGWYDLFDPDGWHPSRRYDEDARLIDHWDDYLRSRGYLR